jgi:hypothetical protein
MADSFVVLPTDALNSGKKVRTQTRVVNAETVHEHYSIDPVSNALCPDVYDTIVLSYTGQNLTKVEYKLGGALISTLTLAYTGAQLDSVVKS